MAWHCLICGTSLSEYSPQAVCDACGPPRKTTTAVAPARSMAAPISIPAVVAPTRDERPGDVVGGCALVEEIGQGRVGRVFVAELRGATRRRVALKLVTLDLDAKAVAARFDTDRQALVLMDHPNVARVFDLGTTDGGRPYFVMELVGGISITDYCDQQRLSIPARLNLFLKVCQAVQHAHQKGIIHLDLKPANILVARGEDEAEPKVTDFGVAPATFGGAAKAQATKTFPAWLGTPAYLSPEQVEMAGTEHDTRTDIYSLGVILYQLLTGRTPFADKQLRAGGLEGMRRLLRDQTPARPSIQVTTPEKEEQATVARARHTEVGDLPNELRGDLDWIVLKALEKDRGRRYSTVNALAMDIQRHLDHQPVLACPPSPLYVLQKTLRRHKLACSVVAVAVLAMISGTVFSSSEAVKAHRAERTQTHLREEAQAATQRAVTGQKQAVADMHRANGALANSYFLDAQRFIMGGRPLTALAYLSRSCVLNPTNQAALDRLFYLLTYHSWPTLTLGVRTNAITPQYTADGKRVSSSSYFTNARTWDARYSPDGLRIATASADGFVRIWDSKTGHLINDSIKHDLEVHSLDFDAKGSRLLTCSADSTARVWDAFTGKPISAFLKHGDGVWAGHFSADGQWVVTASADKTARVWNAKTGEARTPLLPHDGVVLQACFSPDGNTVLTASLDRTARLWNAETGQPLHEPIMHPSGVLHAAFSPDGTRFVTTCIDGTAHIYDTASCQQTIEPIHHTERINYAEFSPDGRWLVTAAYDNTARVWDAKTGHPVSAPMEHEDRVVTAHFSPDGRRVVTASWDFSACVWDARTGAPLTDPLQHECRILNATFSPDGRQVLTASQDYCAHVWDSLPGNPLGGVFRHQSAVNQARFSPDGLLMVSASSDKTAQVWDLQKSLPIGSPLRHQSAVETAEFSPDASRIVTASLDHTARVWDAKSAMPVTPALIHDGPLVSAKFSPDGAKILTCSRDGTASIWDAQSGQRILGPIANSGGSAVFSPDGKKFLTASHSKTIQMWDAKTGQPIGKPISFYGTAYGATFSPDGTHFIARLHLGFRGDLAQIFDSTTMESISPPLYHENELTDAEFSADGQFAVTAAEDHTARIWNLQTGHLVAPPLDHALEVQSARFSPNGKYVVTASRDYSARIWDAATGQPVSDPMQHEGSVLYAEFSPDGHSLMTASANNAATLWDLAPPYAPHHTDWILNLAEANCGQRLDEKGALMPSSLDTSALRSQMRERLVAENSTNDWVVWGVWLLSNHATRAATPYSRLTMPEYITHLIQQNTPESLAEASQIAGADTELLTRIDKAQLQLRQKAHLTSLR